MGDWKDYNPLVAALLLFLGTLLTVAVARLNVRDTNTTTAQVNAKTAEVNAESVHLSDKQYESRWEERLEGLTTMQAANFSLLLERAGETNDRLLREVTVQGEEIKELRRLLAECEARGHRRSEGGAPC